MSVEVHDRGKLIDSLVRQTLASNEEVKKAREFMLKMASAGTLPDIEDAVENYAEKLGRFNGICQCQTVAEISEDGPSLTLSLLAELKQATSRTPTSRPDARQIKAYANAVTETIVAITPLPDDGEPRVERYTTAPQSYDGFGTITREVFEGKSIAGRGPVRRVSIANKHLEWQDNRYGSGLYCCLTTEAYDQALDLENTTRRA